jgi:hypothetical protein
MALKVDMKNYFKALKSPKRMAKIHAASSLLALPVSNHRPACLNTFYPQLSLSILLLQ